MPNKSGQTSPVGDVQFWYLFPGFIKLSLFFFFSDAWCFYWNSYGFSFLAPQGGLIDFYANPKWKTAVVPTGFNKANPTHESLVNSQIITLLFRRISFCKVLGALQCSQPMVLLCQAAVPCWGGCWGDDRGLLLQTPTKTQQASL